MKKIGVYGGAFNPPHLGHIKAAETVIDQMGLDLVVFIPTGDPPHKQLSQNAPKARDRVEMLTLATQGLPARISDIELARQGVSYSVDTLEGLSQMYPDDELYLLMGTDMFLSFEGWKSPERICSMCRIVAFYREKNDYKLEQRIYNQADTLRSTYDAQIEFVHNDFIEISSTDLRRLFIFGGADAYLDQKVADYIYKNGLYDTAENLKNLSDDRLRQACVELVDGGRAGHILGCEDQAVKLAKRWDQSIRLARRAALLHDVTKALKAEQQLILCEIYGIMVDEIEKKSFKLLHPKTGAAVAEAVFGAEPEVVRGILWHTTGRAGMTNFEKIIYLADYIEPTRNMDGIARLRELAFSDIDRAMLYALNMAIAELEREGKALHPNSVAAREYFKSIVQ